MKKINLLFVPLAHYLIIVTSMKQFLFLFTFLLFSLFLFSQQQINSNDSASLNSGSLLFLKEESFDFGKIPQGKPVSHIFEIQNTGKSSLKLDNVQASCGCTTPEWERNKEILSGEKSVIKVGYNAASEGPFTKNITITYNETQNKLITIKGEVWKTPSSSAPSNEGINELKD